MPHRRAKKSRARSKPAPSSLQDQGPHASLTSDTAQDVRPLVAEFNETAPFTPETDAQTNAGCSISTAFEDEQQLERSQRGEEPSEPTATDVLRIRAVD